MIRVNEAPEPEDIFWEDIHKKPSWILMTVLFVIFFVVQFAYIGVMDLKKKLTLY